MKRKFEIGIASASYPYHIRWTNDYVEANDEDDAEKQAIERGYYRNVRLREED